MLAAVLAAWFALGAPGAGGTAGLPTSAPTVSAREAALLAEVEARRERDPEGARRLLDDAVRPESSAALDFTLGNLLVAEDRMQDAAAAYSAALAKHPGFREAIVNLSRVELLRGVHGSAAMRLTALVESGRADAAVYVLLGHALHRVGRPVSAETAFRQALLRRPDDPEARMGLARALLDQGLTHAAWALFREETARAPGAAEAWRMRAAASLALGEEDRALVEIETARRLARVAPDLLMRLGDLYLARGQAADAAAAYEDALAAAPSAPAAMFHAARALAAEGEAERAEAWLARLEGEALTPAQEQVRLEVKAETARLLGRIDEAREAWAARVRSDPAHGPGLVALGDLDREAGALEDASLWYARAARIPGYEAVARVRQAHVEVERERFDRAGELLDIARAYEASAWLDRYREQVRRMAEIEASRRLVEPGREW